MKSKNTKNTWERRFYVLILFIALILTSVYVVILTPFMIKKSWGIKIVSVVSYVLWSIFGKIFDLTFDYELENEEILEEIKQKESIYVISNHLGSIDFMLINKLSKRKGMLAHAKYMIKHSVAYIPILGHVKFLGFVLLKRNFSADKENILRQMRYFKTHKTPLWFVIYPEGSRFTPEKYQQAIKFCSEKKLHLFKNLLYPRHKGFDITLNELRNSHVRKILDVSNFYYDYTSKTNVVPSLFEFLFGSPRGKFVVKINIFNIDNISDTEKFLLDRFKEKDNHMEESKKIYN